MAVKKDAVREMWLSGVRVKEIARINKCSVSFISRMVSEMELPRRKPGPSVKSLHDTPEFRDMWTSGKPTGEIAAHYTVSTETVRRAAAEYGLPKRETVSKGAGRKCGPRPAAPKRRPAPPKPSVGEFGSGSYADIAKVAKRRGWTPQKALQEFHAARRQSDANG